MLALRFDFSQSGGTAKAIPIGLFSIPFPSPVGAAIFTGEEEAMPSAVLNATSRSMETTTALPPSCSFQSIDVPKPTSLPASSAQMRSVVVGLSKVQVSRPKPVATSSLSAAVTILCAGMFEIVPTPASTVVSALASTLARLVPASLTPLSTQTWSSWLVQRCLPGTISSHFVWSEPPATSITWLEVPVMVTVPVRGRETEPTFMVPWTDPLASSMFARLRARAADCPYGVALGTGVAAGPESLGFFAHPLTTPPTTMHTQMAAPSRRMIDVKCLTLSSAGHANHSAQRRAVGSQVVQHSRSHGCRAPPTPGWHPRVQPRRVRLLVIARLG